MRDRSSALGVGILVGLLAILAGCGVPAPTSPDGGNRDGGTPDAGPPPVGSWHLFFPRNHLDGHVVVVSTISTGYTTGVTAWWPGPGDPWLQNLTSRTRDHTTVLGGGKVDTHFALEISDTAVTVTGDLKANSGGGEADGVTVSLAHLTWCYRPTTPGSAVRFTARMDPPNLTASGQDADAYEALANWGGGPCRAEEALVKGNASTQKPSCTSESIKVATPAGGDGIACLGGNGLVPTIRFAAVGGSNTDVGEGTGEAKVAFTVTATVVP